MTARKARTRTPLRAEPFDIDRISAGEAFAEIVTPGGQSRIGRLNLAEMYVPIGPPTRVPRTEEAQRAKDTRHTVALMTVGGMTALGRTDGAIIDALNAAGLLYDGGQREDQLRSLKRWRAEYDRLFPKPDVSKG